MVPDVAGCSYWLTKCMWHSQGYLLSAYRSLLTKFRALLIVCRVSLLGERMQGALAGLFVECM